MGILDFLKKGVEKPVEPAKKPIPAQAPTTQSAPVQNEIYTVVKGDSLSLIAKHYYGDAKKYNLIFDANRDQIKDANLIHPGMKLIIPKAK